MAWIASSVGSAVGGYVDKAIGGVVATAGDFAGNAVSGVGHTINGVGRGIENGIRYYGDGVRDYGNGIKDYTKADGTREQTAGNPLGLSTPGAKSGLQWRPQPAASARSEVKPNRSAPKPVNKTPATSRNPPPIKRTASAPAKPAAKALARPAPKPAAKPAGKPASKPASSKPGPTPNKAATGKVVISDESKPQTKRKPAPKSRGGAK